MSAAPILTGQDVAEAQGALQALLERTLATAGYTRHQFLALRVLASRGPIEPPARLHDFLTGQTQLGLDASAVAGLLGGLEADGLVTGTARDGAGPARLTDAGTALHTRLSGAIAPVTARVYDGVDPADLATAHEVLRRVTQTAEQLRGEI